jgi:hypothetical protein
VEVILTWHIALGGISLHQSPMLLVLSSICHLIGQSTKWSLALKWIPEVIVRHSGPPSQHP